MRGKAMNHVISLFREQFQNIHLIWKLSIYNVKSEYSNHYLGLFWNILQPLMQAAIYYLIFGLGLRGATAPEAGIPFIVYLISGLFPWLFISQAINVGSNAIYAQLGLVTKMRFPSSVLLSISFTNSLINLSFMTLIIMAVSLFSGYVNPLYFLTLIYFVIASFLLIFAINLIMSTLIILVRDFRNVLQNVIRMGFFLTPIFWQPGERGGLLQMISDLNPFAYLVMNFRNALIYGDGLLYGSLEQHIYFWGITLSFLVVGSYLHIKFRYKLIDYL